MQVPGDAEAALHRLQTKLLDVPAGAKRASREVPLLIGLNCLTMRARPVIRPCYKPKQVLCQTCEESASVPDKRTAIASHSRVRGSAGARGYRVPQACDRPPCCMEPSEVCACDCGALPEAPRRVLHWCSIPGMCGVTSVLLACVDMATCTGPALRRSEVAWKPLTMTKHAALSAALNDAQTDVHHKHSL